MHALTVLHQAVPVFSRGGGGGSGSGSGGGLLVLIGYLPMHFLGAWLRRVLKKHETLFVGLQVISWVVAVAYAAVLAFVFRGLGFLAGIGALVGMGAGLYGWFGKLKQSKQTQVALKTAMAQDSTWDEAALQARTAEVFARFQQDWSNNNAEAMKAYMTPQYQHHNALMIYALQLAGRRNMVGNPTITQTMAVDVQDAADNDQDTVTMGLQATAKDQLVDVQSNTVLYTDPRPFTEFWRFQRSGNTWLLAGIQQATANQWMGNAVLEQFAAQNGYYYSLDWGRLLLPKRGQLFSGASFSISDVNNHVIGIYNQQLLVQLYTYIAKPDSGKSYLIAQANLPKSYGDIVVKRRKGLSLFGGVKGLREISTEWPDFNKKYRVFATSPEQATSLELLNPAYMQRLEAAPFEVNIEVVDNVVYLYAAEGAVVRPDHYPVLLGLLHDAFKEMRL